MIVGCLSGYMFLCAFSLLGLIRNSPVGLKSVPEAYVFAAVHGLIIGAVQSYSRTVFCDLVIPGKEAESFALYEITDKGSINQRAVLSHRASLVEAMYTATPPGGEAADPWLIRPNQGDKNAH